MKVLMCVPNISEWKNLEAVEAIVDQVRAVGGVKLLDYSSDPSHHRSVLTYLGEPEPVLEATKAMARAAFDLIDMTTHHGAHPRMGAVDVVPFIPIRNMDMGEAVNVSREFGRFVGEMGIPVYYYEESASRPERVSLVDIRRGEYEALREKLGREAWKSDEGPAAFHPKSGATVTGARFPLVALNVNLQTADVSIARRIADAVRYAKGGYRFVRAMGLALEGQGVVQVSMNLIHYIQTPIPRVVDTIRAEAARYGVNVIGCEVVGPIPMDTVVTVFKHYLQLHDFLDDQIIEYALLE
jgi:glutamate formiminotransferase